MFVLLIYLNFIRLLYFMFCGAKRFFSIRDLDDGEAQHLVTQGEALLQDLGFVQEDGVWRLSAERYTLEASVAEETEPAGIFRRQSVRVSADGETLYELPCSRWQEVNQ